MISKDEWHDLKEKEKLLKKACEILRVEDKDLVKTIERFQKDLAKN
jgi:hypothetical protein